MTNQTTRDNRDMLMDLLTVAYILTVMYGGLVDDWPKPEEDPLVAKFKDLFNQVLYRMWWYPQGAAPVELEA